MKLFSKFSLNKENYFTLLLSLIPISFIAGNMIININILLLIFSGLIFFYKDFFKLKYFFLDKILLTYFSLILLVGIYNDIYLYLNFNDFYQNRSPFFTSTKSLLFCRFLLLYLIIRILISRNILNFKIFFLISSFCALFVCIDIFFQLITGRDFFGYGVDSRFRKLGGPFGDEYIAGGYIQRFSIFSLFLIPAFFSAKNNSKNNLIIAILFLIFFVGIVFSGNRMPLIMFLLSLLLYFIFEIKNKKKFIIFIALNILIFFFIFNFNTKVQNNFKNFYGMSQNLILSLVDKDFSNADLPYKSEFLSGYKTWLINKSFGGGIRNFNFYCHKSIEKLESKYFCNMHPHNYYLEILTETGLIGFALILIIFSITLYISLFKKYLDKSHLNSNHVITPFILLLITEIFPVKSTGSFFTTGNSTYFFIIFATVIALSRTDNFK